MAKHGSVNAAAGELFVTQPAVSASVAALEKDIGVALLAREGRGVRLTPSGEALARYAGESLALLEQGRDAATAAAHPGRGRLRIAAVTTAGEFVVPPLLKVFQTRFPEVEVFLEVGNRALVLERLGAREADLGIGGRPPQSSGLQGRPFLNNDLVLVASPNHPLARRASFDPARLDEVWLLREPGSGTRSTTEEYLAEQRPRAPQGAQSRQQRRREAGGRRRHGRHPDLRCRRSRWSSRRERWRAFGPEARPSAGAGSASTRAVGSSRPPPSRSSNSRRRRLARRARSRAR